MSSQKKSTGAKNANNFDFKDKEEAGFESDEEQKQQINTGQNFHSRQQVQNNQLKQSSKQVGIQDKDEMFFSDAFQNHKTNQDENLGSSMKKSSKTIAIIKNTLQKQLKDKHQNVDYEDQMDDAKTLADLQRRMIEIQSVNVQKKEREEMKKMSESIWNQRNKYKTDFNSKELKEEINKYESSGVSKLNKLLALNMQMTIEEKKKENAIMQKRKYLSKRTKEVVKSIPEFMVSFNDSYRTRWDVFIIILTIYNCFYIPFEISFQPEVNWVIEVLNSIIDLIFYIDIIIQFRTTYMTSEGEEVTDKKAIAKLYIIHGTFFVDVLSIVPLNALIPGDFKYLDVIGMLKLVRISRLSSIIQKLDLREDIKAMVRVCQLTFLLIFYFHLCTCLWYFEARIYEIWIPAIEFGSLQTDVYISGIEKQYFTTMHYSVLLLTGNEMGPRTDFENFLCALYILCGALISANIFGEMAVLIQMIKRKNQQFQEQIDSANTAMKNIRLPKDLSSEIRDYLVFTQSTLDQQQELDKFLSLISPSLKLKVSWQIFEGVIKSNSVFKNIKPYTGMSIRNEVAANNGQGTDLVSIVVRKLQIQLNGPEDIIIKQGDDSQDIYFIAKGDSYVTIKDTSKKEYKNFKKLVPGDHFGVILYFPIIIIQGNEHNLQLPKISYNNVWQLLHICQVASRKLQVLIFGNNIHFRLLLSEIPEVEDSFKKHTFNYSDRHKKWLIKTLRQLPFFCEIEEWTLNRIIYSFKKRVMDKGTLIFKAQEEVNSLRILQDGIIDIFTQFEGKEFIVEKLMRGSLLNHRSFFLEETASVFARAAKTSIVLEISLDQLNSYLADSPIFEKKFLSYQTKILNSGKSFPVDYHLKVPKQNIIDPRITTNERISRMVQFKLAVMRRIQELRIQKSKPKLSDLLKELKKGGPVQRMEVKRKILALYEFDDEEKAQKMKENRKNDDIQMDPEDHNEKNQTYLNLKMKIKRIIRDLDLQEQALDIMNEQMEQYHKNNVRK